MNERMKNTRKTLTELTFNLKAKSSSKADLSAYWQAPQPIELTLTASASAAAGCRFYLSLSPV